MLNSLKNQAAFDRVNRSGKKFYTPYFLTVISKNFQAKKAQKTSRELDGTSSENAESQIQSTKAQQHKQLKVIEPTSPIILGLKASKKLGKAPTRNKIKRRIRHIVRMLIQEINLKDQALGVIVVPKYNFEKIKFDLLYLEFKKIFLNFAS